MTPDHAAASASADQSLNLSVSPAVEPATAHPDPASARTAEVRVQIAAGSADAHRVAAAFRGGARGYVLVAGDPAADLAMVERAFCLDLPYAIVP